MPGYPTEGAIIEKSSTCLVCAVGPGAADTDPTHHKPGCPVRAQLEAAQTPV